jgi:predicted nuclease of predicted toxin-antitoxin system
VAIALYLDEHVRRAITLGLRLRGVDILTVQEDENAGTPDVWLLDRAVELQRVMFSQDQDFLIEANRRQTKVSLLGIVSAIWKSLPKPVTPTT